MRFWIAILIGMQLLGAGDVGHDYYKMKKEAYRIYESGKVHRAMAYVERFVRANPKSVRAQNLLAVLHYWQGDLKEAEAILEKVVAQQKLPEAKRLLATIRTRLHKKDASRSVAKKVIRQGKKAQRYAAKRGKSSFDEDLAFLHAYIRKHPDNVEERKFLLNYYISVDDKKMAARLASEILGIDPDEAETLALVRQADLQLPAHRDLTEPQDATSPKVIALLNDYKQQKAYRRYLNLYRAVVDRGSYLPRYIHLDAMHIAIGMHEYRIARTILLKHDFPDTPNLRKVRTLLDKKLKIAFSL